MSIPQQLSMCIAMHVFPTSIIMYVVRYTMIPGVFFEVTYIVQLCCSCYYANPCIHDLTSYVIIILLCEQLNIGFCRVFNTV